MPNRDKTGPMGQGSLTGRGVGPCGDGAPRGGGQGRAGGFRGRFWRGMGLGRKTDNKNIA